MQLETIEMPRAEARRLFLEYRRAVRARHDAEDEAIMRGYRALADGRQVIDLAQAIAAGGVDEHAMPRLAALRADARWCYSHGVTSTGSVTFCMDEWSSARATRRRIALPPGTFAPDQSRAWQRQKRALVPTVPPMFRPAGSLERYVILWEAEWRPFPPTDPALLRRLGGNLYAVLAVWDLTELEKTVLAGRFTEEPR